MGNIRSYTSWGFLLGYITCHVSDGLGTLQVQWRNGFLDKLNKAFGNLAKNEEKPWSICLLNTF